MEMLPPGQEPPAIRDIGAEKHVEDRAEKYIVFFTKLLLGVAGAGLVGMLVLIVADVIGIKIFSNPVPGGIELVAFLAVIAIAFSVPLTQAQRGHVAVDFIIERFPRRPRLVIECLTMLMSVALFALLTAYTFRYAGQLQASGEVSMTQKIPFYPFVYGMAVCFLAASLVLVLQFIRAARKLGRDWKPGSGLV
jgi:TRAP-type C4-dicarboxylate transport system permease small subunit